jgi:hypothetical protein
VGFLAAIPYTTAQNNKKTINKLNKAFKDVLGFDLVERLMQVSYLSHLSKIQEYTQGNIYIPNFVPK